MSTARSGWATFVSVVFIVTGGANLLYGLAALGRKEYFPQDGLIYESLQSHGWVWIIVGALQFIVGVALWGKQPWARLLGVALAAAAAIVWFFYLLFVPLAGIAMISLAVVVLYGLLAHGDEMA
jgi:hypothetical protein